MSNDADTKDRRALEIETRDPRESSATASSRDSARAAHPAPSADSAPQADPAALSVAVDEPSETISALMGSVTRAGRWEPPGHLRAVGALGSVSLDYREAELAYDVNDLTVYAFMGSVVVTVPRDIEVEVDSSAVLGSVAHENRNQKRVPGAVRRFLGVGRAREREPEPETEPPLLRIRAVAFMGGVTIRVR